MNKIIILLATVVTTIAITSCGASKSMTEVDYNQLDAVKRDINFVTQFHEDGIVIELNNVGEDVHTLTDMYVHITNLDSQKSLSSSMIEHTQNASILPHKNVSIPLQVNNLIQQAMNGKSGTYAVSITYKSRDALAIEDDRNLYYIKYNYK